MSGPKVVNMRLTGHRAPAGAVRVDRRTKWGNPYKLNRHGTRAEVVEKYEAYLLARPDLMAQLGELEGLDLACWCAPDACHADVLLKHANAEDGDRS